MIRICNKCGEPKDLYKDFAKDGARRAYTCRICAAKRAKIWRENNKDHIKEYDQNRDRRAFNKAYYEKNKVQLNAKRREARRKKRELCQKKK